MNGAVGRSNIAARTMQVSRARAGLAIVFATSAAGGRAAPGEQATAMLTELTGNW
jgi:hypothetical protein